VPAAHHGLTVYNTDCLEIASRRKIPLTTLDRELREAASAERVELLGVSRGGESKAPLLAKDARNGAPCQWEAPYFMDQPLCSQRC
jgi:hypothetical protein